MSAMLADAAEDGEADGEAVGEADGAAAGAVVAWPWLGWMGLGTILWSHLRCSRISPSLCCPAEARVCNVRVATYSAPALYRAQTRLARLGYHPGPIDGDFGPMTSRAIRSYQADYGLPITGRLTAAPAPAWESEN